MLEQTIGFLGAGKMGEALARGIIAAGLVPPDRILMSDMDAKRLAQVAAELKVRAASDNAALVSASDVVIVALKPAVVRQVLPELARDFTPEKLVVSIAAGIRISELERMLPPMTRVIRVMPNAPCVVRCGAAGFALGSAATPSDKDLVERILSSVGFCVLLPEDHLDAVTGLSGSGPAFVALVIDALAEGGERSGLEKGVALRLAEQTVLGTVTLMLEKKMPPAELRRMIATPGGTTVEGLKVLDERDVRAALAQAVEAAARKSKELGRG